MSSENASSKKPLILAFLIGGGILLGLSFFAQTHRRDVQVVVPPRKLLLETTAVNNPVRIRFVTPATLSLTDMGWMAGDLHLHAQVDSVALMAGPTDLARITADTFVWTLPTLRPGRHVVSLFWADMRHRPIGDSVSGTLLIGH